MSPSKLFRRSVAVVHRKIETPEGIAIIDQDELIIEHYRRIFPIARGSDICGRRPQRFQSLKPRFEMRALNSNTFQPNQFRDLRTERWL